MEEELKIEISIFKINIQLETCRKKDQLRTEKTKHF